MKVQKVVRFASVSEGESGDLPGASKLLNEFLETKRRKLTIVDADGREQEKVGLLLEGPDLNAVTGCLRTILDSKKFGETVALKLRDDTLKRELDETVTELEDIKKLLVERGIITKNGDPIH